MPAPTACAEESIDEVYARRIQPLLESSQTSSCNQCHLSGIDLSMFARGSACQSMACLEQLGLVNFGDPDASVLLTWIERASPDSELITEDVIAQERDAVLEWIRIHARCDSQLCPSYADACNEGAEVEQCGLELDPRGSPRAEDPGDCSDRTLELLFQDQVYRWRGRCYPCHDQGNPHVALEAPKWVAVGGSCNAASLATLREVERRGFMDLHDPTQSPLLLKPLAEKAGGIHHEGHAKFSDTDDVAYVDFLSFIERYAACR